MSTRRKKPKTWHRDLSVRELDWDQFGPPDRLLSVKVYLPRPLARIARREVYPYPVPLQKRLKSRVIRHKLRYSAGAWVLTQVRIRVPKVLPLSLPSYVSLSRGKLHIHSRKQHKRLMLHEFNRPRYTEGKSNHRKARYGQLDSPGALSRGLVAYAARRFQSANRVADAALVARAILKGGR